MISVVKTNKKGKCSCCEKHKMGLYELTLYDTTETPIGKKRICKDCLQLFNKTITNLDMET